MDLITLIIIIAVVVKMINKNKEKDGTEKSKKDGLDQIWGKWEQMVQDKMSIDDVFSTEESSERSMPVSKMAVPQQETAKVRPQSKIQEENAKAMEQVHKSRMEAETTSILDRAKENTNMAKEDVTLKSLEESHGHSAHVAQAVHHHPEDVIPEDMLEKIEDLIVKGYEPDLCFERDFLGEAMDMVSKFSLGGSLS